MHDTKTEQKRPKILYVITKSNLGGAQRHVLSLATHFKTTHDVTVAVGGTGPLTDELYRQGIKTMTINRLDRDVSPIKDLLVFLELLRLINKEKPTILHLHSSKIGGIGSVAGRLMFVSKVIYTGHGWAFNEERGALSRAIILSLHWLTIMFAHRTIAVSDKTADDIARLPLARQKLIRIYNGIPNEELPERETARRELKAAAPALARIADDRILIGTTSELHTNKGLIYAFEAIRELSKNRKIAFVVLGEGERRSVLEQYIADNKLEDTIFLPGFVSNARQFLKAFDIFTLTSITEAMPYSVLDAGLAKLPVVASNVGGIPEIIEQLKSGILTKPRNVKEITEALTLLIDEPAKRESLGAKLHETVTTKFSEEKMFGELEKLYRG